MRPRLIATMIVQIWIGECVLFQGKDGHDIDGGLSLGKGKASGRVDVPRRCQRVSQR